MKKIAFLILVGIISASNVIGQTKTVKELKVEVLKNLYFTSNSLNEVCKTTNNQDCRLALLSDAETFYKEFDIAYQKLKVNLTKDLTDQFDLIINVYSQVAKTESFQYFAEPSTVTAIVMVQAKIEKVTELLLK